MRFVKPCHSDSTNLPVQRMNRSTFEVQSTREILSRNELAFLLLELKRPCHVQDYSSFGVMDPTQVPTMMM